MSSIHTAIPDSSNNNKLEFKIKKSANQTNDGEKASTLVVPPKFSISKSSQKPLAVQESEPLFSRSPSILLSNPQDLIETDVVKSSAKDRKVSTTEVKKDIDPKFKQGSKHSLDELFNFDDEVLSKKRTRVEKKEQIKIVKPKREPKKEDFLDISESEESSMNGKQNNRKKSHFVQRSEEEDQSSELLVDRYGDAFADPTTICISCKWSFIPNMTDNEKEAHVNLCLEGLGEKHKKDYLESIEKVRRISNGMGVERQFTYTNGKFHCPICLKDLRVTKTQGKRHYEDCVRHFSL